jgi:DNA-binding LytR/AlgR family response regulator
VVRDALARLERDLERRFVRVHRSAIVNRTYRSLVEARLGRSI